MPNNVDSVIANEALQQTSTPPCSPRLFIYFSAPLQLATKRLAINHFTWIMVSLLDKYTAVALQAVTSKLHTQSIKVIELV